MHVERAVRLDVLQRHAGQPREFAQRAELVDHVVHQLVGRCIDMAAPEAHEVAKARVRADAHAVFPGQQHRLAHDVRITRMKACGDIGRADQRHQFLVHTIADGPWTEAFAHVGVQINQRLLHVSPCVVGTARWQQCGTR
jgi:hypothetical protein